MNKLLLFLASLNLSVAISQQRLGLDFNTSGTNVYGTLSCQKVIGSNVLVTGGILFGQLGRSTIIHPVSSLNSGLPIESPYVDANAAIQIDNSEYKLLKYRTWSDGIAIQLGAGYFHSFSVKHGIKFQLNGRFGFVQTRFLGNYQTINPTKEIQDLSTKNHFISAISPEISHTIRLTGRSTFCYGFKLPYYFKHNQISYKPKNIKDKFYGLEPEFNIGVTYNIGNCD